MSLPWRLWHSGRRFWRWWWARALARGALSLDLPQKIRLRNGHQVVSVGRHNFVPLIACGVVLGVLDVVSRLLLGVGAEVGEESSTHELGICTR